MKNEIRQKRQEVIALIPARGGSKGIPNKNIVDVCGKPLIAYSIESAQRSPLIDRIVVSTDSEEIADVARNWGAEVPFLRPESLSEDSSLVGDAVTYSMNQLDKQGYQADVWSIFYPTHPFRPDPLVNRLLERLCMGYASALTARPVDISDRVFLQPLDGDVARTLTVDGSAHLRHMHYWRSYGLLYGFRTRPLTNDNYIEYITDEVCLIDIDDPEDLEQARTVVERRIFDYAV